MIDLNIKNDGYVDQDEDSYSDCKNGDGSINKIDSQEAYVNNENEPIDPRIQIELERLNRSSTNINHLENELKESKTLLESTKSQQSQRIEYLKKKLEVYLVKSKPYYDALQVKEKLQKETQIAVSHYKAAKETLGVVEQILSKNDNSDVCWQEYVNETVKIINNCKKFTDQAEQHHRNKALEYQSCIRQLQNLEKNLKRNIEKSQSYYNEELYWNIQIGEQNNRINDLEHALNGAKKMYSEAMNNLGHISEEIHLSRQTRKMHL